MILCGKKNTGPKIEFLLFIYFLTCRKLIVFNCIPSSVKMFQTAVKIWTLKIMEKEKGMGENY
jgi:hypothetical protein